MSWQTHHVNLRQIMGLALFNFDSSKLILCKEHMSAWAYAHSSEFTSNFSQQSTLLRAHLALPKS